MTLTLIAVGLAVLAWPAPRRGTARLHGLVGAARLPSAAASRKWRWAPTDPSPPVVLVGAAVAGVLGAVWHGPAVGVACCVGGALVLSGAARAAGRAVARSRDRDLSAALRLLRAELEVGSTGAAALAAAATVAGAYRLGFDAAAAAARDGADVAEAVGRAGGHVGEELSAVARAWRLAADLGVPIAGVLARVDEDVQARRAQSRVVAAALAGPRSSAALLAGLPVLGVVLGAAMGARPLHVLIDSGGGRLLLCAGALFDAAGVAWTARLIASAERS